MFGVINRRLLDVTNIFNKLFIIDNNNKIFIAQNSKLISIFKHDPIPNIIKNIIITYNNHKIIIGESDILQKDILLFRNPITNTFTEHQYCTKSPQNVYIISQHKTEDSNIFILDIINKYKNNKNFIFIKNKNELLNIKEQNSILIIQYLMFTDIHINDILQLNNKLKLNIIIHIHDLYWLCNPLPDNSNYLIYDKYLKNNISINSEVTTLFNTSSKIICSSIFLYTIMNKYFSSKILTMIYNNDSTIYNQIINIPQINNNEINLGIIYDLYINKGSELIDYLIKTFKSFRTYKINYLFIKNSDIDNFIKSNHINGFLLLHKYCESYCYILTKIINSGLPIFYNNIGVFKERLISKNHYIINIENEDNYNNLNKLNNNYLQYINYIILHNNTRNNRVVSDLSIQYDKLYELIYKQTIIINKPVVTKQENIIQEDLIPPIDYNKYPILFHKYILNISNQNTNIDYEIIIDKFTLTKYICHFHIYNLNTFNEFAPYILDISNYFSIIVTYSIGNIPNNANYYKMNIIKCKNIGADVGGKIVVIDYLYRLNHSYDYMLFLHSKTTFNRRMDYYKFINNKQKLQQIIHICQTYSDSIYGIFPDLFWHDYKNNINYSNNLVYKNNINYLAQLSQYIEISEYKIFNEGNCMILHKKVIDYIFKNKTKLFYNILNNYTDSFDVNWVQVKYNKQNINISELYNDFKNKKPYLCYNNKPVGCNFTNPLNNKPDGQIEHSIERIWINTIIKLNKEYLIMNKNLLNSNFSIGNHPFLLQGKIIL